MAILNGKPITALQLLLQFVCGHTNNELTDNSDVTVQCIQLGYMCPECILQANLARYEAHATNQDLPLLEASELPLMIQGYSKRLQVWISVSALKRKLIENVILASERIYEALGIVEARLQEQTAPSYWMAEAAYFLSLLKIQP